MSITHTVEIVRSTGEGREKRTRQEVVFPSGGESRQVGVLGLLEETFDHADFADGGGASGTIQFAGALPKGAVVVACKVLVPEGFAGDTSAVLTIGDGSDVDRYMTGTPSVFAAAADGVEVGAPSGARLLTAENRPTLTVTTDADWGSVTAGQVTVSIYYIET